MLNRVLDQVGFVFKRNPFTFATVFTLSVLKIAADIVGPIMFVNGIEELTAEESDSNIAMAYLAAGFGGLQLLSSVIPLIQERLLIPAGTKFGAHLTREAGKAFFNIEKEVLEPGESYEFLKHYGGSAQPGGIAHSLLPVTNDALTSLTEMIAINIAMGIEIGEVTWLASLQTVFYLTAALMMSKLIANGVVDFIKDLYKGFSNAVIFASDYEVNILCNQQEQALDTFYSYLKVKLNKSTERYLSRNIYALLFTESLGGLTLICQLIYAVKRDLLTSNEFILMVLYQLTLTKASVSLTRRMIEGISSYSLFVLLLAYMHKGALPNAKDFNKEVSDADIVVQGVSYTYPKSNKLIFDDFSLEIKSGEVVAITGPNGTGKSTLFNMFFGFTKPDAGKIKFAGGQNIAKVNPDSLRSTFLIIPQKAMILPGTFKFNIAFSFPEASNKYIRKIMKKVGLYPTFKPNTLIKFSFAEPQLSGGEKQRLMIARALLTLKKCKDIKYLFCDEGLSAIDPEGRSELLDILNTMIKRCGLTAVIVTHNYDEIGKVIKFDQVIQLRPVDDEENTPKQRRNSITFFEEGNKKFDQSKAHKAEKNPKRKGSSASFFTDSADSSEEKVTGVPVVKQERSY